MEATLFLAALVLVMCGMTAISWMRTDIKHLEAEMRANNKAVKEEMRDLYVKICAIDERSKKDK